VNHVGIYFLFAGFILADPIFVAREFQFDEIVIAGRFIECHCDNRNFIIT
jgi:hypothetical protein